MYLTAADYGVTLTMLMIPVAIGVFYAWKDSKKTNKEEYLLGGRRMHIVPVAMSIYVTHQSAIGLIGTPSEIYRYGPMVYGLYFGFAVACLIGYFTMVPLMHPLQLTSIYDYLEMRYKSRALRMLGTVFGMLHTYFYMVTAMLAPGLALKASTGIPFWMSVAVVGGVGTLYTAIGGFKSVVWTDVFQAVTMVAGLVILIIMGTADIGGFEKTWSIAEQGGRTFFNNFNPDPRVRHSWWSTLIGGGSVWLLNIFGQANLQRVSSMKMLKSAKMATFLGAPCQIFHGSLLLLVGVIAYSYFYAIRCDPLEGGLISNINEVSLYFMVHLLQGYPGMAGFYMATIFSGALSTLSSGINALAANTVEDVMAGCLRGVSEKKVIFFAKVMVFIYGFSIIGLAYLAESFQGPLTQIAVKIVGIFGSVVFCMFLVGCTVPWANKYGAFAAGLLTSAFNLWILLGNFLHGRSLRPLPSPPTDNCSSLDERFTYNSTSRAFELDLASTTPVDNTKDPYQYGFFLYDISYEWYGLIGTIVGSVTILIVSWLTRSRVKTETDPRFTLHFLRKCWNLTPTQSKDEHELNSSFI